VTEPLRVVIGEDSYLVREGLVRALEDDPNLEVVGVEGELNALRETIDRTAPDVVVTDVRMPPANSDEGIRLAVELGVTHPDVGVVVLSNYAYVAYATALFAEGGARRAYVLKHRIVDRELLLQAIDAVVHERPMLDPEVVSQLIESRQTPATRLESLTAREHEVLAEIAKGRSNAAIARALVLTKRAVERHINSIFAKLELSESESVNRRVLAALLFARAQQHPDPHPDP
jgi:DNA-binding NarL/FixJ family response regulator